MAERLLGRGFNDTTVSILAADAVLEHCRQNLAPYKKPGHVLFIDALPTNASNKVLKTELRARAAAQRP